MSGFVGNRMWLVAVASVMVSASGAVAGDCDTYAKHTLQQVKQNIARGCKFSGPRWSLDVNRHRAWCKEVGPAGWRAELKIRNTMLEKNCKG